MTGATAVVVYRDGIGRIVGEMAGSLGNSMMPAAPKCHVKHDKKGYEFAKHLEHRISLYVFVFA